MIRFTKKRKAIYNILENEDKTLSANDIYERLSDKTINLTTVYRSLEYFYLNGLVGRTNHNAIAYYYISKNDHYHYMICEKCHKRYEIDCKLKDIIKDISNEYNFEILSHDLSFYGICSNCQTNID